MPPLPTGLDDWRRTVRTVGTVLSNPPYATLALAGAVATLVVFVASENRRLVWDVVLTGSIGFGARLQVFAYLLPFVGTVDPAVDGGLLAVSALSGIAVASAVYRRRRGGSASSGSKSAGAGVALGAVAGGCAACGSAVLAAVFGIGAAGALAVLPFDGVEILWLAAGLLGLSTFWITDGMNDEACSIDANQ